jgi:hypothetical protein
MREKLERLERMISVLMDTRVCRSRRQHQQQPRQREDVSAGMSGQPAEVHTSAGHRPVILPREGDGEAPWTSLLHEVSLGPNTAKWMEERGDVID